MSQEKDLRRAPSSPASSQCCTPLPIPLDELIVEILSWLPVKSLLRFRCVCRSWKSLISDPQFGKLHLHRLATSDDFTKLQLSSMNDYNTPRIMSCSLGSLLSNPSSTIAEDICYPPMENRRGKYYYYSVEGSCNGLLCVVRGFQGEELHEYWVHLWNPATRLGSQKRLWLGILSTNYRSGFPKFGFGYDHLSDSYKVVAVRFNEEDLRKTLVKVHTFHEGDKYWRQIQSFPAVPLYYGQSSGVYLSGTLNWVAIRNLGSGYRWDTVTIDQLVNVSLDLGKETCIELLLPQGFDEVPHVEPRMDVLRDCLCFSYDYKRTHFVLWQMKEFGVEKSWSRLVNVAYLDLQTRCPDFGTRLFPICMSKAGDVLIVSNSVTESRMILFNSHDNSVELCKILHNIRWYSPKVYIESLVTLPPC